MTNDEYLQSQLATILQPGEQVLHTAYMRRQPGILMQMLLVGGLLLYLITKVYFVVLTNRRMILIKTKMKFLSGGPQHINLGVEQWELANIAGCTTSGFAYNRSMTWQLRSGGFETLRIAPIERYIYGSKRFFNEVPQLFTSGQLAGVAPQQQLQPPMQPPMQPPVQLPHMQVVPHGQHQPMSQPPMQHMQPVQPQPPMQYGGVFPPGTRVTVIAQDGNRYQGTVAQAAQGQYLCTMPDGQSYWFPTQNVGPA